MREQVMSAGVLFTRPDVREEVVPEDGKLQQAGRWNPADFAREQIRGLVRKVFFSKVERPVRQVVFSALDLETDVRNICRSVGEALAVETVENVAVVGAYPQVLPATEGYPTDVTGRAEKDANAPLRRAATRVQSNLWLVPAVAKDGDRGGTATLHSYMGEIRSVFEYSIVEGPPAGESNHATATAQFADGIILVLSAHRTRRIAARKVKEMLEAAQARILGTVLSDRTFPIPDGIYRRL
jgi:succinoglycan biosynthesis transport protein ExoP